ncbi:MAG: hypothetical protein ABI629_12405 [bacterium]
MVRAMSLILRILSVLVLVSTAAAGQPCPGDTNGDRAVTIAEVIAAVSSSLNGCPPAQATATPTPVPSTATNTVRPSPTRTMGSCPFSFFEEVFTERTCAYEVDTIGDDRAACRGPFKATWISNGIEVGVVIRDLSTNRTAYMTGPAQSANLATLNHVEDDNGERNLVNGFYVQINNPKKVDLVKLNAVPSPPVVGRCELSVFNGPYIGLSIQGAP